MSKFKAMNEAEKVAQNKSLLRRYYKVVAKLIEDPNATEADSDLEEELEEEVLRRMNTGN